MSFRLAAVAAAALLTHAASAQVQLFGPVSAYNGVILGNMSSTGSDTEGRLAIGGHANLQSYAVGHALPNSNGSDNRLVVGGNLTVINGQVSGGNVRHAGTRNVSGFTVTGGQIIQGPSPFSFSAAGQLLRDLSSQWGAMSTTGSTTSSSGTLTLSGSRSGLNVFTVSASQLSGAHTLRVVVPSGATVLVNVSGASVTMQNFGFNLTGVGASKIMWNMRQATTLSMSGIGVEGSVLAPHAAITFNNGQLNGQLFGLSFNGNGQLNHCLFHGLQELTLIPLPPAALAGGLGLIGLAAARRLRRR